MQVHKFRIACNAAAKQHRQGNSPVDEQPPHAPQRHDGDSRATPKPSGSSDHHVVDLSGF